MSSRFPSIEDFDEGATTAAPGNDTDAILDASDLLSREQALLGEDAVMFQTGQEALTAGDEEAKGHGFDSAFPEISVSGNEMVGPGGTITGSASPYLPDGGPAQSPYGAPPTLQEEEEEPEVIREWRERQALEIARRDEASAAKKDATILAAQQAIDDFYENYNLKKDKAIENTRREAEEFLASRENTVAGGTSWERIAKLVDLSEKGASRGGDKTRFRELLLSLKKDEKAPGAVIEV